MAGALLGSPVSWFCLYRGGWPAAYWDDWMRLSTVRQGRQCIRPEICRTYNFGEKGSSHGQYYTQYLKPIKLNSVPVDWRGQDLGYLTSDRYAAEMDQTVSSARLLRTVEGVHLAKGLVKLMYASRQEYESLASAIGIIGDWKDGVPRAGYQGVVRVRVSLVVDEVITFYGGVCFLVPAPAIHEDVTVSRVSMPLLGHKEHRRIADKSITA